VHENRLAVTTNAPEAEDELPGRIMGIRVAPRFLLGRSEEDYGATSNPIPPPHRIPHWTWNGKLSLTLRQVLLFCPA
jgi:hypothetical protein